MTYRRVKLTAKGEAIANGIRSSARTELWQSGVDVPTPENVNDILALASLSAQLTAREAYYKPLELEHPTTLEASSWKPWVDLGMVVLD